MSKRAPDGTLIDEDGFIVEVGHPGEGSTWESQGGGCLEHHWTAPIDAPLGSTNCPGCERDAAIGLLTRFRLWDLGELSEIIANVDATKDVFFWARVAEISAVAHLLQGHLRNIGIEDSHEE